jgi:iron complex transport system ATP-binding protein
MTINSPPRAGATDRGPALLQASDIEVSLGGRTVLRGVSCAVERGEMVGIVGPNGSGKTTLLRTVAGLSGKFHGVVTVAGEDTSQMTALERARRIAYLPQNSAAGYGFTAMEIALMGRYPHLGRFQLEGGSDREIAMRALERTETAEFADRRIGELSGGERQRVLMARALAQTPLVLLLDEPTSSLDLRHQLLMMEMVRGETANGIGAIAVLHDLSLASRFCDRMVILAEGQVVDDGPPEAVLTRENLRAAFEVDATVSIDPLTGRPRVALVGPAAEGRKQQARIHLICGAGSGRYLMQSLVGAGYEVTLGGLGEGDTDREAADHLDLAYLPVSQFIPLTEQHQATHEELVRSADVVIVCDMPVGPNNLVDLEVSAFARKLLVIEERDFADRDYTGGVAAQVYAGLTQRAEVTNSRDVLALVTSLTEEGSGEGQAST